MFFGTRFFFKLTKYFNTDMSTSASITSIVTHSIYQSMVMRLGCLDRRHERSENYCEHVK
jgi:hypothetical protein